jgi:hypothetical protein
VHARIVSLIAILLFALAPASAEASRKLSIAALEVPATGHAGEPLPISGTVRNSGDERARTTVRAYLQDTLGQLRIGGRRLPVSAGAERDFSLSPALPNGVPDGDYEISVCARRLNRRGPANCSSAPLTVGE